MGGESSPGGGGRRGITRVRMEMDQVPGVSPRGAGSGPCRPQLRGDSRLWPGLLGSHGGGGTASTD